MTKDWSCTAWGADGEVQVSVLGKSATDAWPRLERQDGALPEGEFEVGGEDVDQTANDEVADGQAMAAEALGAEVADLYTQADDAMADVRTYSTTIQDWFDEATDKGADAFNKRQ